MINIFIYTFPCHRLENFMDPLYHQNIAFDLYFFFKSGLAIGTAATPGLLCQPRVMVKMITEKQMECRLAGETEVLGENLPQGHFCPSQNPT
jgi:hypothetical protein